MTKNMRWFSFVWLLLAPFLMGSAADVRLLETAADHLTFQISFDSLTVHSTLRGGRRYSQVLLPNAGAVLEPGKPYLPMVGFLIGLPPNASPRLTIVNESVKIHEVDELEIVEGRAEPFSGERFPAVSAELGEIVRLRDYTAAIVRIYPARYSFAQKTLQTTLTLTARIDFSASAPAASAAEEPIDAVINSLMINAEQCRGWKMPQNQDTPLRKNSTAGVPQVRLYVEKDGVYSITGEELARLGVDLFKIDPRNLALAWRGKPKALLVEGAADGRFDYQDRIIFVGEHLRGDSSYYSPFSDVNVYQLSWSGAPALRFAPFDASPKGAWESARRSARYRTHLEEDLIFDRLVGYRNAEDDHWFWRRLTDDADFRLAIDLPNLVADSSIDLKLAFHGLTVSREVAVNHHVQLLLGDRLLGEAWGSGCNPFLLTASSFSASSPLNVSLRLPLDIPSVGADQIFLNWIEAIYEKSLCAQDGFLAFDVDRDDPRDLCLSGFDGEGVYFLTADGVQLTGCLARRSRDGVEFLLAPKRLAGRVFAASRKGIRAVDKLELDQPSDLHNPQNGADYILITHSDFAAQAQRLADYRASQGLRVAVVDVQDVFDEFSGGIFDPRAVRSFLKYAFENWRRPAPAYVLLLGDATLWMNKKIAWNHPQRTFIPSMMVYTFSFGMTSSDNYFAAVSGDDELPDLFIGRLPANSPEEAGAMIDKIIAYETKQTAEEWRRHITVAAGTGDFFGYAADYVTRHHLPEWLVVHRLDAEYTSPDFHTTEDLIGWINSGQNILNFLVHGAGEQIDDAKLLEKDDLLRLNNSDKYPFCSTMSCYIGHFDDPERQSLGESLLSAPEKGIMALFGSAGKSYRYADFYFNNAVFDGIFRQGRRSLGEITTLAKYDLMAQTRGFDEPVRNFMLLGDPALRLRLPEENLTLTLSKSVLVEGDALRVSGNAPSRGTLLLTAVTGRSTIAEQRLEVEGAFTVDLLRLTPQVRSLWGPNGGVGHVKGFFSNGGLCRAGALSFGISQPLLRRFGTQPDAPVGMQPFQFVAEIDGRVAAESGGIRSLTAQWKIGEDWKDAPLSLVGDGIWKSGEFAWEEGTVIDYRLKMVTGLGETVTDSIRMTICYKPDLYTDTPLRRISGGRPELLVKIKNRGDSDARNVPLTIRELGSGSLWADRFVVPWVRSRADTLVRIPAPNAAAGSYELELLIDPEDKVAEEEENNNRFVQILCLATPENGSAGAFRFMQDQVALILPPNSVERPSSLELNAISDAGLQRAAESASLLSLKRPGANSPAIFRFIFADTTLKPLKPVKASIDYDAQDSVLVVYGLQSVRVYVWESVFGLWRAVPTQHLPEQGRFVADLPPGACVFALMANSDKTPPTIRIDVLGQNFADGDITPQRPQFVVSLSDESGVDVTPERLQISLDGRLLSPAEYALNFDAKEPRFAHLSFKTDFDGGEHELHVSAGDLHANSASRTVRFRIAEEFGVRFVANHPNPFLDETVIAFYIDDVANKVKLDIYTVSGRHIRGFEMVDVSGYQEVVWDGMDKEGEPIANGVYYLKFTAVRDDRRIERIEKMAKLE